MTLPPGYDAWKTEPPEVPWCDECDHEDHNRDECETKVPRPHRSGATRMVWCDCAAGPDEPDPDRKHDERNDEPERFEREPFDD